MIIVKGDGLPALVINVRNVSQLMVTLASRVNSLYHFKNVYIVEVI